MKKVALITFLILVVFELIANFCLKKNHIAYPIFVHIHSQESKLDKLNRFQYKNIDPLLGWSASRQTIESLNLNSKNDCIILNNFSQDCDEPFTVLITGGSTSDIVYDDKNWPIYLEELIAAQHPCYEIYLAATGGFHSGQELLQSISFRYKNHPDLHISYSGCNDYINRGLSSQYENDLLAEVISPKPFFIFPSTLKAINFFSNTSKEAVAFTPSKKISPNEFWLKNQITMHNLGELNGGKYISFLQPVFNFSGYTTDQSSLDSNNFYSYLQEYSLYYPELIEASHEYDFIHDFTTIFKDGKESPFVDDCHLKNEHFQQIIANAIFTSIDTSGLLDQAD